MWIHYSANKPTIVGFCQVPFNFPKYRKSFTKGSVSVTWSVTIQVLGKRGLLILSFQSLNYCINNVLIPKFAVPPMSKTSLVVVS